MIDPSHDATRAQIRAARPEVSSWVSANAGSGKTRVLTDRVARLLLGGTNPTQILCLTYTKAAAAEMQNRLFKRLGAWAMMEDAALRAELESLGEPPRSPEHLAAARTLFARAIETPGGLKIQTIHAFCDRLLRRFPVEARISPSFELMEDRQAKQLADDILDDMAETPEFTAYAPYLVTDMEGQRIAAIRQHRALFETPPSEEQLRAALNLDPPRPKAEMLADIPDALSPGELAALTSAIAEAGGAGEKAVQGALASMDEEALFAALITAKGEIKVRGLPTTKVKALYPNAEPALRALSEAALRVRDQINGEAAFAEARALHGFASSFLGRFRAAKQALGRLDFDDLISHAAELLSSGPDAAWVQYKLDNGIAHVLVDEAQDTSPGQWHVIKKLTSDFFAGEGAAREARTIFVVGDEKQSIYSFQGADPTAFDTMHDRFAAMLRGVEQELADCDLLYSFRSAEPILRLVDQIFAENEIHGLGDAIRHRAFADQKPGRVDLWPFVEKEAGKADEPPWDAPIDVQSPTSPPKQIARQVAAWAKDLLASGAALPGQSRTIEPKDILILVRSRGEIFKEILRALAGAGLPVSGADRLKLTDSLAVRDLLSLLRFLATEDDDLALAEILRSPLFGLSEGALYTLAHERGGTLWQALAEAPAHAGAAAELRALRASADFLRPFEILSRVLISGGGRARLAARLGPEAEDAIDALLDLALAYEQVEPPTLLGFLEWIRATEAEVKRQLDGAANEIRVMTIHGAKGLEAPIVVMPQTHRPNEVSKTPVLATGKDTAFPQISAKARPQALQPIEDTRIARALEEAWRLLYVGLTRAESWLIVCGGGARKGEAEMEWYTAVENAMESLAPEAEEDGTRSLRWNWPDALSPGMHAASTPALTSPPASTPPPALTPPPASTPPPAPAPAPLAAGPKPPATPKILIPSRDAPGPHALPGAEGDETAEALSRGTALHTLLDALAMRPALGAPEAEALLPGREDLPALLAEAKATREAPALAWLWTDDALTEIPVSGHVAALGARLRGRIDRLVIGAEIWAVDFKSNRRAPQHPEEIPAALIGQMALYHAALAEIFPGQPVRTGLVWTVSASFMEIPHKIVRDWLSQTPYLDAPPPAP